MARMHSRDKGKSRSYKPIVKTVPEWVEFKPKEVEMLIVKLAKQGKDPSQIGAFLRDHHGIPDVKTMLKKSITQVLAEKDLLSDIPEDLMNLLKKEVMVRKHLERNHKDEGAKRGLILTQSKTKRLVKYYRSSGRLPQDWKYDPKQIALLIE
ncbi:30S ribosomal protein S15 [Candidatus Woesearchaeota archaeon]|nr:30S ribosomal protein S15 [Candidatus Woesearchaeota archaeon]